MSSASRPRQIAILVYPGVQSLDVTGPLEVFTGAQRLIDARSSRDPGYAVRVLSPDGEPVLTSSGLAISPDGSMHEVPDELDTLVVAGGYGHREIAGDQAVLDWIAAVAGRARRTASVCTGAFLLARAGLLEGRRATTHWSAAQALQRAHPEVLVDAEPIFVRDGPIWTSAGVTAGMDLALALVEEDLDRDAALTIARHLVLFLRRPANQSQFSATLTSQQPERTTLRELQRTLVEDVAADHSVEAMAARAHMSPRHFARVFRAQMGVTPARYVERVRLEAARRRIEDTDEPLSSIAAGCGFGSAESMRRAFLRALRVGPAEYRRRFHAPIPHTGAAPTEAHEIHTAAAVTTTATNTITTTTTGKETVP